ncbi:E3 SUMO-protein ligase PIAS2 [Acipenser ruthenus]|uniref:E3 SUMO-protein ligase PIAS2 n=1 Tax=Acipenser ruthenus TaxID=7906 RepID=A0A444UVT7_ACIRT|nr:E3 SUMO-protein ligase PIAS2 [Acipenser ruthenus]
MQTVDTSFLPSALADYAVPFHHSTLSTIPTDMQGLDFLSLIQGDPQQYCAPMFLDTLGSTLQAAAPSSGGIISSSSSSSTASHHHQESSSHHSSSSSSRNEAGVGTSITDIISLD